MAVVLELLRDERVEDSMPDASPLLQSLDDLPGGRDAYPTLAAVQPYGETRLRGPEAALLAEELRSISEALEDCLVRSLARRMLAVVTAARRDEAFTVRFAGN